jgi:hypothetical protein
VRYILSSTVLGIKIFVFTGSPIWDPEFNGKTPAHVIAAAQAAQATEAGAGSWRRQSESRLCIIYDGETVNGETCCTTVPYITNRPLCCG